MNNHLHQWWKMRPQVAKHLSHTGGSSGCSFTKSLWKYIKKQTQRIFEPCSSCCRNPSGIHVNEYIKSLNRSQVAAFDFLKHSYKEIQFKYTFEPNSHPLWLCGDMNSLVKRHRVL